MQVAYNCYSSRGAPRCTCRNQGTITYQHIKKCLIFDRAWTITALVLNSTKEEIQEEIELKFPRATRDWEQFIARYKMIIEILRYEIKQDIRIANIQGLRA